MATNGKVMKPLGVLRTFFGQKDGQSLQEFAKELGALSPEDKQELSEAAAKELGVELAVS